MSNHRLDVSIKDLTDEQHAFFEGLIAKHGSKATVVKFMIDQLMKGVEKGTMRNSTHDKIHDVVTQQMALNASTDKVIRIGEINPVDVKYEQRTITAKWIQDNAGATQQACLEYLEKHKPEIEKHHKEVLGLTDSKVIKNFNRRTGKASARIKQL